MPLRSRWIVRVTDPHDEHATGPYCVECRATCRVLAYGTLEECRHIAREANKEYNASIRRTR